ncbi:MAG: recombination regulator RecX [Actinobacteria bacterium]|nr:recombination regulator RecX [Actinomycetota bacterium]
MVVDIDGQRGLELARTIADAEDLRVGTTLSEEDVASLDRQDEPYRARSRALYLLATRDRSSAEIETRLSRLGFGSGAIEATLEWLRELGYVEDARFIRRYAAEKARAGWAERRIRAELVRQGLDRELVELSLSKLTEVGSDAPCGSSAEGNLSAEADSDAALLAILRRRFSSQLVTDRDVAGRKIKAYLARRGHDWETIDRLVQRLKQEDKEGSADEVLP